MGEIPHIKLFTSCNNYYMYDVNKNTIIKIKNNIYKLLSEVREGNINLTDYTNKGDESTIFLNKIIKNGFLSSNKTKNIENPLTKLVPYLVSNNMEKLSLQITQQCNLRCDYCVYSGSYHNRVHSNKRMSFETAKKGIDLLIQNSKDSKKINIGFYGGEPLLEFELIKKCIHYIEAKLDGREISYYVTSNGTLITEKIIEFFSKYKIHLTLSLDGPKEVHDKNRVFARDGAGTFDKIMKNITLMKNNYPEYYNRYLAVNAVMDGKCEFGCIAKFFCTNELLKGISIMISQKSEDTLEKEEIPEDFYVSQEYEFFHLLWSKYKKKPEDRYSKVMEGRYLSICDQSDLLTQSNLLPEECHHGGPCVAGAQKLFMDTSGNFFPCERVSESSEVMKIGHIDEGFYLDKISDAINIGKITEEECKNCWAIRLCRLCAKDAESLTGEFSKVSKLENCIKQLNNIESNLKDYCILKELGFDLENTATMTEFDYKKEEVYD